MRASAAAALAHTPCPHQHNIVDHSFSLAVPRVARRHFKDRVSNWRASSSSSSVTKRVTLSFTPGSDCRTLVLFFQTCCAPFVENARSSSAGRSQDELAPPKTLEKKEGVPRWNQCWRLWARQIGVSSAWFYSLAWSVFIGTLPILRGSDRDPPAKQRRVSANRAQFSPSVRETKWKFRSNIVSMEFAFFVSFFFFFFLFFFSFIFTFFRNGQGQNPPSPKRACPYFGKCGNLRTVPCGFCVNIQQHTFFFGGGGSYILFKDFSKHASTAWDRRKRSTTLKLRFLKSLP